MISKKAQRRLLKLAVFLRTVPRKRFDYSVWVGTNWRGAPNLSCGTTACALGWATTMPEFRRLGLRMSRSFFGGGAVRLGRMGSISAAMTVFDIDEEAVNDLFIPKFDEDRATPKYVARKIERFVAENG